MSSVSGCGGVSAASHQNLAATRSAGSQKAQQLFAKLDVNGDGSVDASELQSLTDYISEKTGTKVDSAALMKAIDTDGNGSISSTELSDNTRKLFHSLREQLMGSQVSTQSAQPGPPDAGRHDSGRLIASLLEKYGTEDSSTKTSSPLAVAA